MIKIKTALAYIITLIATLLLLAVVAMGFIGETIIDFFIESENG